MPWVEGDALTPANLNNKMASGFAIIVTDDDFGAVGDGTTNDTVALQAAFDAVPTGGGTVIFPDAGTYVSADVLTLKAGTTVELNGSTLKFTTTAAENNLLLRSGCVVQNGTVENAGTGHTGHGGNGCPIVIGDYSAGTGYSNIAVRNLTLVTAKDNGNGIIVTGNSHNVLVENIKVATTAKMGRAVLVHWGNADAPASGTEHPHDIVIRNVNCGDLTYNDADVCPVLLSGCYNIVVENVTAGDITNGRAILVYAGDYGAQYADAEVARQLLRGIIVRNHLTKSSLVGVRTNFRNISGTVATIAGDVVFEGLNAKGNAPTSTSCLGVDLTHSDGAHFRHCTFDGFNKNITFEATVANASFRHCTIANAYANGINTGTTSTPNFMDVEIAYNIFEGNNTQTTASRGDLTLNNAGRWDIIGNYFNSELNSFGIRVLSTSSSLRIFDNHVSALTAGGTAYSLGAAADPTNAAAANNTAATGITLHGGNAAPFGVKTINSTDGSAIVPAYAYTSDQSLGFYRSAASTIAQSYGTLSLPNAKVETQVVVGGTIAGVGTMAEVGGEGKIHLTSGQAAAYPEYSFSANTNTGMYQAAANVVGISAAGSAVAKFGTSSVSLSGVTFDLKQAKLSLATTGTAVNNTNLGVDEIKLFVGGTSGATLCVRSGGTIYYFGSILSAAG